MLGVYLIDGIFLRLIEAGANRLLQLLGGPDHVPHRNEDLVWY
jgi:hypothetical protein